MKILITGAGGAAAVSVWKSLNQEHQLFMADADPCAAGLYLVPEEQRFIIPYGESTDFLPTLLKICQQHHIELLIPTVDTELLPLAENAHQYTKEGIKLALSPAAALALCRDKYSLLSYCQKTGHTPEFKLLTKETALSQQTFPCFTKPRIGAGSRGASVINHAAELEMLPKDGSYLVQELLPGDEYSVDVYIHSDGTPIAAVPRLRMKIDSGIAVAAQTCINPKLCEMALDIAQLVGIRYVANVQFKANEAGEFKLLEINPRFPGTLPLTAAAGIDMPKLLINDLNGVTFSSNILPYKEIMVVRYWTEQFCAVEEWAALCQQ